MKMAETIARFRQWTYPRAFRIDSSEMGGGDQSLALAVGVLAARAAEAAAACRQTPNKSPSAVSEIPEKTAINLCNHAFRIDQKTKQMQTEKGESQELNSIRRALSKIKSELSGQGVEYIDPIGQAFTEGRMDFDPLGPVESRPGLKYKTIVEAECPVVMIHGQLKQRARGIVAGPN